MTSHIYYSTYLGENKDESSFFCVEVERNDDGDSFVNLMGKFGSIGFNRNLDNYVTSLKAAKGPFHLKDKFMV